MPLLKNSSYKRPFYLFNSHLETILPALTRRVEGVAYERERLELPDGDFLDLDWIEKPGRKLVILTHGLEGDSQRHYIKGMAKHFAGKGWSVLAWHCRSCSGEMNRLPVLYGHGEIGDIGKVIQHALHIKDFEQIVLIGFSMGGSISIKYLSVYAQTLPAPISKAVVFSTPCNLRDASAALNEPGNTFYRNRFLKMLEAKIRQKAEQYPDLVNLDKFGVIHKWEDFDNHFSAPINGYRDADEFYEQSSALHFISGLRIPVLLVNALNDPILTPSCSPVELARQHPCFYLETPAHGGHVGFSQWPGQLAWSESRAWEFVQSDG